MLRDGGGGDGVGEERDREPRSGRGRGRGPHWEVGLPSPDEGGGRGQGGVQKRRAGQDHRLSQATTGSDREVQEDGSVESIRITRIIWYFLYILQLYISCFFQFFNFLS